MDALTKSETGALAELEAVVEKGKRSFVEVGSALAEIRDHRLYRATHKTFEDYCRERWGWNRAHANQIISGAEAVRKLPQGMDTMVSNQRQARELAAVAEANRPTVVQAASESASARGDDMTA